ncbi:MAG: RNA polymerase sigma factor [Flavobacteriales bacterium]
MKESKIGHLRLDQALFTKLQRKEEDAVLQLYDACFSILMNVVVRYKSNREDQVTLVHNSFLKALDHLSDFTLGTSFVAWVKMILQREIIDDYRRNKRRLGVIELNEPTDFGESLAFDEQMDVEVEIVQVKELLSKLPPTTCLVFNLFLWDELSPTEIAKQLEISVDTVRWHIKIARKLIRQQIELT